MLSARAWPVLQRTLGVSILASLLLCRSDVHDIAREAKELLLRDISGAQLLLGGRLAGMPFRGGTQPRPSALPSEVLSGKRLTASSLSRLLCLVYILDGHL